MNQNGEVYPLAKRMRHVATGLALTVGGLLYGMHHTAQPDELLISTEFGEHQYGADTSEVIAGVIAVGGLALTADALTRRRVDIHINQQLDETIHN